MKFARALLFGMTLAASLTAFAQYSWTDKDGRRVFSDRPPPNDVPQKNVIAQPRGSNAGVVRAAPAADAPAPAAAASAASAASPGVDKALEEKRKQAEAEEAAKKKADEQRLAAGRADNCKRAMNSKAMLDSGQRVARMNDKGEREVINDEQRAAESKRVEQIIAQDCK